MFCRLNGQALGIAFKQIPSLSLYPTVSMHRWVGTSLMFKRLLVLGLPICMYVSACRQAKHCKDATMRGMHGHAESS